MRSQSPLDDRRKVPAPSMRLARMLLMALCVLCSGRASAQPFPPTQAAVPATQLGNIEGRVIDADTGEPIADASVWVDSTKVAFFQGKFGPAPGESTDGFVTTSEDGAYTLRRVPPGKRVITVMNSKGTFNEARLHRQVGPGETVTDCLVRMRNPATISGRVSDEKGEPLVGVRIHLVVTEHHAGKARQYLRPGGMTDENGEYRIEIVVAGRTLRLMAEWAHAGSNASATSKAPADPKLRRPAYSRVFYPDAPDLEGATVLRFRSGEERQGIDFLMRREPSRCIEGKFVAPADVKSIHVMLQHEQPAYGSTRRGGSFGMTWGASLDGDPRFRICQLAAGTYRLRAYNQGEGRGASITAYASQLLTVGDRDVTHLEIPLIAPLQVSAELEWAGAPPEEPPTQPVRVSLEPLDRAFFMGEQRNGQSPIPGRMEMAAVLLDDYSVTVRLPGADPRSMLWVPAASAAPAGLYVKDVRYGDDAVQFHPARVGMQPAGTPIKVLVGHDAGSVTARVTDAKGKPAGDSYIYLLPADVANEEILADALLVGQADQYGQFTWQRNVPPGTYRAAATRTGFDYSPEAVHALWQARSQAPEIRVPPNGNAEVTVKLLED